MEVLEILCRPDVDSSSTPLACVVATLTDVRRTGAVLGALRVHFSDDESCGFLKRVRTAASGASACAASEVLLSSEKTFATLAPRCWDRLNRSGGTCCALDVAKFEDPSCGSATSMKADSWVVTALACGDIAQLRICKLPSRGAAIRLALKASPNSDDDAAGAEQWPLDIVKLTTSLPGGFSTLRATSSLPGDSASKSAEIGSARLAPLSLTELMDGVRSKPDDIFAPPLAPTILGGIAEPSDASYIKTMIRLLQSLESDATTAGYKPQACVIACRASDWVRSIEAVLLRASASDPELDDSSAVAASSLGRPASGGAGQPLVIGDHSSAAISDEQRERILEAVSRSGPYAGTVVRGFAYGRSKLPRHLDETASAEDPKLPSAAGGCGGAAHHEAAESATRDESVRPEPIAHPLHSAVLLAAANAAAVDRAARAPEHAAASVSDDAARPPPHKRARLAEETTWDATGTIGEERDPAVVSLATSDKAAVAAAGSPSIDHASLPKPTPRTHPSAYLCTGTDAFLSEEPDFMDAMALVHCRVARVFFLRAREKLDDTGALFSGRVRLHTVSGLNHRYRVFHVRNVVADDRTRPSSHETACADFA